MGPVFQMPPSKHAGGKEGVVVFSRKRSEVVGCRGHTGDKWNLLVIQAAKSRTGC